MSKDKNKKESEKPFIVAVVVIAAVLLGGGFYLYKHSPENSSSGSAMAAVSETLNSLIGKPTPNIELTDKNGKIYSLSDFKGKSVVLFFNEGLMCYPACWDQISAFGSDTRFNSNEIQAIAVVPDSVKDWQKAINQMPKLDNAMTLFDSSKTAAQGLDLLNTKSSMHKGSLPGHTYIVIDKEGIVRYVFDDPNMAIANDMLYKKIQELNNPQPNAQKANNE